MVEGFCDTRDLPVSTCNVIYSMCALQWFPFPEVSRLWSSKTRTTRSSLTSTEHQHVQNLCLEPSACFYWVMRVNCARILAQGVLSSPNWRKKTWSFQVLFWYELVLRIKAKDERVFLVFELETRITSGNGKNCRANIPYTSMNLTGNVLLHIPQTQERVPYVLEII